MFEKKIDFCDGAFPCQFKGKIQINTLIHLSLRQNNYYLNRGAGFSGGNVIRFGSNPHPQLARARHKGRLKKRGNFLTGEREGGGRGRGAEYYDRKKA
jgi:hypothetical protein